VYSIERGLAEHGAKLSETERAAIEQALSEARDALKADDVERIRRAQESLTRASQSLTQAMYREARSGTTGGGPQQPSGGPKEGEVVDAEFTDADERKAG